MIEGAGSGIIGQHLSHFLLRESHHLVELLRERVVSADIESAGEIVHRNGTDTCDGIGPCFYLVEKSTQIAFAMCLVGVVAQTLRIGEDSVGEVVIFVDEKINSLTGFVAFRKQIFELADGSVFFVHFFFDL